MKTITRSITYAVVAVPIVGLLALDLFVGGHINSVSRSMCEWILLAASRHLPGNPLLLAGCLLLPLAAMYRILERQAAVAEVPAKLPQNQAMFNWGSLGNRS